MKTCPYDPAARSMQTSSHPHWRGLDGLRAIAVIAVVIYHFSPARLPGGFLGVDIFFVISGYLITRLITQEFIRRHRIDAPAFYRRRARRLLPALGVVLAVVGASALIWRDQLATVRPGIIFSALFSANWWLAFDHQPYFVASGRPSMLQHLWSLGVEEQFYLFWPLILAVILATGRRRYQRRDADPAAAVRGVTAAVSVVAITLALLSTGLTWLLADLRQVPYGSDGSTLYYGTDTHCMGLLLGAALGAWAAGRTGSRPFAISGLSLRGWQLDAIGAAALVTVLVLIRTYTGYSHSLYRGGFLFVTALVAVVIAVATGPASRLGSVLEAPLLRWVGVRSYSLYLWHWPIAVVTRPGIDTTMPTWIDQLLRVAVTVALAHVTYRYVETPVRRLGFTGTRVAVASYLRRAALPRLARPAVAVAAAVPVIAFGVLLIGPKAPRSAAAAVGSGGRHISLEARSSPPPYVGPRQPRRHQPHSSRPRLPKISGFGDSVLLDARHTLAQTFGGGSIDAVVGRQPGPILGDVRRAERSDKLNPVVVIQAGNNGLINPADLTDTLRLLSRPSSKVRAILVVNDHLDPYNHYWQNPNNATIARVVAKFPKARLVNWNRAASRHHNWLYSDDLHLRPPGEAAYAALLAQAYRATLVPPTRPGPAPTATAG